LLVQIFEYIRRLANKNPSLYHHCRELRPDRFQSYVLDSNFASYRPGGLLLQRLEEICPEYTISDDLSDIHDGGSTRTERVDKRWHIMLRIMYLYAMMNPCTGHIQALVEILYVLLCVVFDSRDSSINGMKYWEATVLGVNSTRASEADTFWCFSLLIGEFRELFDLGGTDLDSNNSLQLYTMAPVPMPRFAPCTGIAMALRQCSKELRNNDETLWLYLCKNSLDPQTENYSLRWILCLFAADLPLHMVVQIWDVLLTERHVTLVPNSNAVVDALVDMCCAMLLAVRDQLLNISQHLSSDLHGSAKTSDIFLSIQQLLRTYPITNPRPIISLALQARGQRLSSEETGLIMQDPGATRPNTTRMRAMSDSQTRSTKLQARLAATVQRGLSTPSQRAISWDYQNISDASANKGYAAQKGGDKVHMYITNSKGSLTTSDHEKIPSPSASAPRLSDARHLLRKYTDAIQESDTVANVSKASTNLAAKALNWRTASPSRPGNKASLSNVNIPDLPIPNVLDSLDDRDTSHPTIDKQWSSPAYTSQKPIPSDSPSVSEEADTSSSLVLPSLESTQNLVYPEERFLSSSSSAATQQVSFQSKPGIGLRRSRPLPSRKDDIFVTKPLPSINMPNSSRHPETPAFTPISSDPLEPSSQDHLEALASDIQTSAWIKEP